MAKKLSKGSDRLVTLNRLNFISSKAAPCSRSNPGRSDAAADFLRSLSRSDVVVWTDDSVPSPLGAGGAGVQAACRICSSSSSSLSYSAGSDSSSFSVEFLALEWCHSHLKACHFQSALFLIDSQLAFALLSTAPAFIQSKSFWDIWDLSDSLSSRVVLSFQWVPSYADFP